MMENKVEYMREYRQKNKARLLEYMREYRATHKAEIKTKDAAYRAANRESIRDKKRAHRLANPNQYRERKRAYYKANRAKVLAWKDRWRRANPEKACAAVKRWQQANPAKVNAYGAWYRAAKRKATPAWIDRKTLEAIYKEASAKGLTVDHIIPLVHPQVCGLHVPWNLQLLTKVENSRKQNSFLCD